MSKIVPWSTGPNAPQIPYDLYLGEKVNFAGFLLAAILYGVVAVLFFRCMDALLNPTSRTTGVMKWGLTLHTVLLFLCVTVDLTMTLDLQSISYLDKRAFKAPRWYPGPLSYQNFVYSTALSLVPSVMFQLNQCLADGLLIYRCYALYGANYWVIAVPCLLYLGAFAMGVLTLYSSFLPNTLSTNANILFKYGTAYYSLAFSLNALVTIMIVVRLFLHSRNIRNAFGAQSGANGVYKAIVVMIIESFSLYAIPFLVFFATFAAESTLQYLFNKLLSEAQVIAPLLIIPRVVNRKALTNQDIVSGNIGSFHFKTQESTVGDSTLITDGCPIDSVETTEKTSDEISPRTETTTVEIS